MGAVHIVFIAINLAIPYWIWSRNSDGPGVNWNQLQIRIERLVEGKHGGFPPCPNDEVVMALKQLCKDSSNQWSEKETVVIERATADAIFSCEVKANTVVLALRPQKDESPDLKCHTGHLAGSPGFVFDLGGKLQRIEFTGDDGQRQAVAVKTCRYKLKQAAALRPAPADEAELLTILQRMPDDPSDHRGATQACLWYDLAHGWKPLRAKYATQ